MLLKGGANLYSSQNQMENAYFPKSSPTLDIISLYDSYWQKGVPFAFRKWYHQHFQFLYEKWEWDFFYAYLS